MTTSRKQLVIWLVVLSPLLAFVTFLLGLRIPFLALFGIYGLPPMLLVGYILGRTSELLGTFWASVVGLGLSIAGLPWALTILETSTDIRLKDPAGIIMAWGFFVTVHIGGVVSTVGGVALMFRGLAKEWRSTRQ